MAIFPVVLALFLSSVVPIVVVAIMMLDHTRRNDYWSSMPAMMPVMIRRDPDAYSHMDLVRACSGRIRPGKLSNSEAHRAEYD